MLKKIMKAALAASLVFGMSSFAYAGDLSVGGAFRSYFGQSNTGVSGSSAYFDVKEEANVKINAKAGKLSVYHELESATDADYNNTQTKLSYALPFGLLSIGNQTSIGTIPMSASGWTTSNIPYATRRSLIWAGYSENEGIGITIPLEGMGMIQAIMYEDSDNAAASTAMGIAAALNGVDTTKSTWATTAATAGYIPSTSEGSSMQLAADLKFGQIGVRVGYASAKTDNPASSADKALTTSNMLVGVKVGLGENMSVAADYATAKVSWDPWSDDLKATCMDADFSLGGVGPGKIVLSVDMTTVKGSDKIYARTVSSVVFDAPVAPGAGFQIGYIANAYKLESTGDTTTSTYMGGGLYAFF